MVICVIFRNLFLFCNCDHAVKATTTVEIRLNHTVVKFQKLKSQLLLLSVTYSLLTSMVCWLFTVQLLGTLCCIMERDR